MRRNKYDKRESEIRTLYKKAEKCWDEFKENTGCVPYYHNREHSYYIVRLYQQYYHQIYKIEYGSNRKAPKGFRKQLNRSERLKSKQSLKQFRNQHLGEDLFLFESMDHIWDSYVEHIGCNYRGADWLWW